MFQQTVCSRALNEADRFQIYCTRLSLLLPISIDGHPALHRSSKTSKTRTTYIAERKISLMQNNGISQPEAQGKRSNWLRHPRHIFDASAKSTIYNTLIIINCYM